MPQAITTKTSFINFGNNAAAMEVYNTYGENNSFINNICVDPDIESNNDKENNSVKN